MEIAELSQNIAEYFSNRPEAAAVYLFGSYALNAQKSGSDVDIGILFYPVAMRPFSEYTDTYLRELPRVIRKDIHPVIMNNAGELLAKQILGKGRCIHVKDQKQLSLYKMRMYSMIAEFGYYREKMKAGFIRHVME